MKVQEVIIGTNKKLVMIQSFPMPKEEGVLEKSETTMAEEMKKQNRGKVILAGCEVDWPKIGDTVSYLRHAATDVEDTDGKTYQLVNQAHVLVTFGTKK